MIHLGAAIGRRLAQLGPAPSRLRVVIVGMSLGVFLEVYSWYNVINGKPFIVILSVFGPTFIICSAPLLFFKLEELYEGIPDENGDYHIDVRKSNTKPIYKILVYGSVFVGFVQVYVFTTMGYKLEI